MIKFLDLYSQYQELRAEIDSAIAGVIRQSAFVGGQAVRDFESAFAAYQQARCCVGVANGTDAIEIALEALGLPPQSEVIVPANSFIATSEAVTRAGHRVVFADIDPVTMTLDVADTEQRVTSRTKAIIAVHLYGHPCNMAALSSLAHRHHLRLIEDCAQAHGAEFKGRRVGAIGDIGAFSFYPGKNLGAYGDAGAIVTNDEVLGSKCRMIGNHGRMEKYNHVMEGRNSRLDGLQAAVLKVKLKYLDSWIERRNAVARGYIAALSGIPGIGLPTVLNGMRHAFHLFVMRTDRRDEVIAALREHDIETGVHYPVALPRLEAYRHLKQENEPARAIELASHLLSLPIGEHMHDAEVARVTDVLCGYYRNPPSTSR